MVTYTLFDPLGTGEVFEEMCHALLLKAVSPRVVPFAARGADGGRDAVYEGTSAFAPGWGGRWIFQAKFVNVGEQGIEKARQRIRGQVGAELEKVRAQKPNHYILLTNVVFTPGDHDWLRDELVPKFRDAELRNIEWWDGGKLAALLRQHGLAERWLEEMSDAELRRWLEEIRHGVMTLIEEKQGGTQDTPTTPRISISHLPTPGPQFVGREAELARLTAAWEDPHTHLVSIVAWGGVGKSALVDRWLTGLEKDAWKGAARVYGWSFYSQGTKEQSAASADIFIDRALRWFGDPDPTQGSPRDRGLRLADLVRRRKTLLVLDGVEPLQHPPGPRAGRIKDPALAALLKELARQNPGLCVVTTREALADVAHLEDATAPRLSLEELSVEDGAALLEALGVHGRKSDLLATAEEFGGHALALNLLGTYLKRAHGGDVRRRGEVPLLTADAKLGGHAFRVMEAYVQWFAAREEGEGPEVAVLRLLGLFDRPAEEAALAALREEPAIPGLTEELVGLFEEDWRWALSNLEECRLAKLAEGAVDAHPLVREWFGAELKKRDPTAFRAGHRRLYEHYKASAPELPETLEKMQPLYAAVIHGCRAGEHDEAFNQVYWQRIARGNEHYQIRKLGAFGADLAALAGFFEHPWDCPVEGLAESDRAWLLNAAGFCLRALGRLPEAGEPMEAGLKAAIEQEDWNNAARYAGNLSELSLTVGEVARAVTHGKESVRLADRSGDGFMRMANRTTLADALHQAGRWEESREAFREAELMQAELQPHYPRLYSLQGYQYCDLLLALGEHEDGAGLDGVVRLETCRRACEEVAERAEYGLEGAQRHGLPRDIALDHVSLGRAHLGFTLSAAGREAGGKGKGDPFATAAEHLDRAVEGLRAAGDEHHLPRGLLARAAFRRLTGDLPGAAVDLDEAQEIAERGSMRLFLCDAHLEWARLHRERSEPSKAREHLEAAARLVEETGYERRRREVEWLRGRVG